MLRWKYERGKSAVVCHGCPFVLADDVQIDGCRDPDRLPVEAVLAMGKVIRSLLTLDC